MFSAYSNDNDSKLMGWNEYYWYTSPCYPDDHFVENPWVYLMYPYCEDLNMYLCPSATDLWGENSNYNYPSAAWDFKFIAESEIGEWCPYHPIVEEGNLIYPYGSYGKNEWIGVPHEEIEEMFGENFIKTVYVNNRDNIPLFGDCNWAGGYPFFEDEPTDSRFHGPVDMASTGEINRWNLDRHDKAVNMLFLDWSARKVGLRELWTLKWSRQTFWNGEEYVSGWGNLYMIPDPDIPEMWPEWMRD
jgi:prepilin-type processing-associated H-X9-DG protein